MDAARAAAMSDPERNPNFRRRWHESVPEISATPTRSSMVAVGTLGLALQEAIERRRRAAQAVAVASSKGDPPR